MNPGQVAAGLLAARRRGPGRRRRPLIRRVRREDRPWGSPVTKYLRPMTTWLRADQTAAEAITSLRELSFGDGPAYLYVLQDGRLKGMLPVRRLLTAAEETPVSELMVPDVVSVPPTATMAQAMEILHERRLLAVPVVRRDGRPLGLIDVEQFATQRGYGSHLESQAVFQLLGIHLEQARTGTVWAAFRDRFPWLLANIGGGMLAALLATRFEAVLAEVVALAMFLQVVLALAESVSIQAMTLAVRSLQTESDQASVLGQVLREGKVALWLALCAGGLVGVLSWLIRRDLGVAWVVAGAIAIGMIGGAVLGATVPGILRRFGRDPRIAAGPLVLATTDIITLTSYLGLATLLFMN